jgi:hypothetical protein
MHPIQSECDPNSPEQHAAWCWAAGIPDPSPSRPMPIPLISPQLTAGVSKMLWDFGFRFHPELQTVWVDGVAGLGMVAGLTENRPAEVDLDAAASELLAATNPELMEMIKNAGPDERQALVAKLEKSFGQIQELIDALKEG